METYQPIYDAVRSRLTGCNLEQVIKEAIPTLDTWSIVQAFQTAASDVSAFLTRPSIALRVIPIPDGNQWIALYGTNLQEGIAGCGDTAEKAMLDFDRAWYNDKLQVKK